MITVVRMESAPDDVVIDQIGWYADEMKVQHIYNFVKLHATFIAKQTPNSLVEMKEFLGFPHASVWVDDRVTHEIFATDADVMHTEEELVA